MDSPSNPQLTPVPPPRCPECGLDLASPGLYHWLAGPWVIMSVYCPLPECRHPLYFQILPAAVMPQTEDQPQKPGPKLYRPS